MKNLKLIGSILEKLLKVFVCVSIVFLILLYPICKKLGLHFDWFIIMIYPCGISFLYIVYQFIKLFDSLKKSKPFCRDNVSRFRKSMFSCFVISCLIIIAFLLAVFAYSYYSTQFKVSLLLISLLFFAIGVALYILSVLFDQAANYKEENDLTI